MARRSWNTPPPPTAFMGSNYVQVDNAIRKLAMEQRHMATRFLTVEDLRLLFIPAHERDALKEAFRITEFDVVKQALTFSVPLMNDYPIEYGLADMSKPLMTSFSWSYSTCNEGFFVPRKYKARLQEDAPEELVEKLEYVTTQFARISFEFGLVRYVFQQLNQNGFCNTPPQMRYVWPAIRHIVDKAGLKDLAPTLIEASSRAGDKARVPPLASPFLVHTTDIINRTTLMDKINVNETREFGHTVESTTYTVMVDGQEITFDGMS